MAGRRGGRRRVGGGRVEASYGDCDGDPVFVIEDPASDGAWIAVPAGREVPLAEHR